MIKRLAGQLRLRETQIFLCLTIIIGVLAGLSAVFFALAIERSSHWLFGISPSPLRVLLVPTAASLVAGVLLATFFRDARGSGLPETGTAFHENHGIIPARVPLGKFITGVLCVGSGHSLGREGPSIQIGAGIASLAGRWLRLPPQRLQALAPIGAAAALSAAFNTPLAAVVFVLEAVIGDFEAAVIGPAIIASVTAVIVERSLLGNNPWLHVPGFHLVRPVELLAYAGLGIIGGIISLIFCKGLLLARALFKKLPRWTVVIQPAIGGLMIGGILIVFPQVMAVGYEYVDQALNGGLILKTMMVLCAVKLVATIISYASGNAGGIFAPSLYLGAMAGGAVGIVVRYFAPASTADPGAYALVGMGALFAGIMRAPITSVFLIFELTQDYRILAPLLIGNLLSFTISRYWQREPIYRALPELDRIFVPEPQARVPAAAVVEAAAAAEAEPSDIMVTDAILVPEESPIEDTPELVTTNGTVETTSEDGRHLVGRNGKKPIRRVKRKTI